jgi:hypothetical protein
LVNRVILVYDHASTITGAVTADRELTFANNIVGIIGDSANDRLFVEDATASTVMVFDGASAVASGTGTPTRTINLPDVVQKITLGNGGDRLYGLSTATAGVFIVSNADIVSGPVPLTFVASPGGIFPTAIAVAP